MGPVYRGSALPSTSSRTSGFAAPHLFRRFVPSDALSVLVFPIEGAPRVPRMPGSRTCVSGLIRGQRGRQRNGF